METLPTDAVHLPQTTRFMAAGSYEYQIPAWADTVDVVLLGGGGGGGGGTLFPGYGGLAGSWETATLTRGTDIPWETTTITGVVGVGGEGGPVGSQTNGGDGQPTTATAPGMTSLSAAGGDGSGNGVITWGVGSGSTTLNGETYSGSGDVIGGNRPGAAPGGGGSGGFMFGPGADGARGQVWFRASVTAGS